MKILQINATYGYSSTGIIVKDIDLALQRDNIESIVVHKEANCKPFCGYKIGGTCTSKIHAIISRLYGAQGYGSLVDTQKLIKILEIEKPSIVHLHNLHSNYVNLNMLLKYIGKKNIATVITLHDCWFFTGKCSHFLPAHCYKWKTHCEKCPQLKNDVPSLFFDRSSSAFDDKMRGFQKIENLTVVGCSKWITELAKESPIFQNKRFVQIYNGVDQTVFVPSSDLEIKSEKQKLGLDGKFVVLALFSSGIPTKEEFPLNEFAL